MARVAIVLLPFLVGVLVYADTLTYNFVWDDLIILGDKVSHYQGLLDIFREPAGLAGLRVYRPITFGSYWLDYLMWGRTPLGFHLTGVIVHAANAALVAVLALGLGCATSGALIAGLLFAVHPVHSESVSWIACRADLLMTMFTLLTIGAALRDRRQPHAAWLGAIAAAAFAAVGSKEVGVGVPLILIVLELGWDGGRRARWYRPAAAVLGVLLYLLLRPSDRAVGLGLEVLTPDGLVRLVGAFGFYVRQTLVPWGVTAYVPEAPGGIVVWLWALAGVAGGAWLMLCGERSGTLRRVGIAWFALTLGPPLLVAVAEMLQTKVSERYLYLPSVGLALILAGEFAARRVLLRRRSAQIGVALVVLLLAGVTVVRNRVWYDGTTLWSAVVTVESRDALPFGNLGLALKEAGRLEEAEAALTAALGKRGDATNRRTVLINLGHLRLQQRRAEEAIPLFEEANALGPHAWALHGLGIAYRWRAQARAARGDATGARHARADAVRALQAGLRINARNHKLHFVLAGVRYDQGRYEDALRHYRRVVELAPGTEAGRMAAGAIEELAGRLGGPAR